MIRNIFFMMLGGLLTTFVLTIIALCQAAGEADRAEEDYFEYDRCDGNENIHDGDK